MDIGLDGCPMVNPDTLTCSTGLPMTERQLQDAVITLAGYLGYLAFHPYDSRKSAPGWPDLVLCGHGRCIVAELKRERGRISADQQRWLDELALAGMEVHIWRPVHWSSGAIERVLRGEP